MSTARLCRERRTAAASKLAIDYKSVETEESRFSSCLTVQRDRDGGVRVQGRYVTSGARVELRTANENHSI